MNAEKNRLRHGVVALVAGLLVSPALLANPSAATTEVVSRTIDIRGVDLSSPLGAQHVYRQIETAAREICWGTSRTPKSVARRAQAETHSQRCFEVAVAGALAEVTEKTGIDLARVAGAAGPSDLVAGR